MRLLASLQHANRWHELLAEIEVKKDTCEPLDDIHVRRHIEGTIRETGPIWTPFMEFWRSVARTAEAGLLPPWARSGKEGGHDYLLVKLIQVDYDLYTHEAAINIEERTIRLKLVELYTDPIEEYPERVRERNQRVEDFHRKLYEGPFTVNDLRALRGHAPFAAAHGARLLPAEALAELRKAELENPLSTSARNFIT